MPWKILFKLHLWVDGEHILLKPPSIVCRACNLLNTSASFLSWAYSSAILRWDAVVFTLTGGHKSHWSRAKSQDRQFSLESSGQLSQTTHDKDFSHEKVIKIGLKWKICVIIFFFSFCKGRDNIHLKRASSISFLCEFSGAIFTFFSYYVSASPSQ